MKRIVEWLEKVRPTKKGIIERLIRRWMPKYKLVKIRGPYKKKHPSPCTCNECVEAYGLTSPVPDFTMDGEHPVPSEGDQSDQSMEPSRDERRE